jgi:arylsulfatase A
MKRFSIKITAKTSQFAPKLLIALLFFMLVSFQQQACADTKTARPNVLFIAVDDLNDWIGCLGGHPQAKTPNIDRLASRGMLFEQAYCSAPLCNPSRMATMTGLRSSTIDIWSNEGRYGQADAISWFRDKPEFHDLVTIPQYFRQHGYTAVMGGKIFHKPSGKFSDPVSWNHQYSTKHGTPFPKNGRLLHGLSDKMAQEYYQDWADWQPLDIPDKETADRKTAEGAAAFLLRDHDKPFFLACGIFRPHLRWYAPRKYFNMHPLEKIKLPATLENDLADVPPSGRRQSSGGSQAFSVIREHGEWKKAVQGYLASCSFADACVGVVLDALEKSKYADNTIIVLSGDHGFHIGQKDRISKLTLWEQGSKTPLIISTPDLAATGGKQCQQPVSLVDLYPTLVELCGLPARDRLDGRSIVPLLLNPKTKWPNPAVVSLRGDHAVRSTHWHYIRYSAGDEELYDATKDPNQWKNLANDTRYTDVKNELKKWLPKNKKTQSGSYATQNKNDRMPRPSQKQNGKTFSTTKSNRKPPNVITLLVDDLGYRDIGCYGGPVKTPVLDMLAAEGVRFTDFHSGAPVCSPSRATFLTGRNHIRAGVYSVLSEQRHKMHLLRSETTLAEVLKGEGFGTAHFGKWHLGMPVHGRSNPTPSDHGFDYWFGLVNGAHPSHKDPTNFLRNGKPVGPMKGYSCQLVVDEAIDWIEKHGTDAPFFINIWFNEPHAVIAAPDEIVSEYGSLNDQAAIYNGTIDNTDRAIGRLVTKLKELGELDNTIIHYSSDNGSYRQERSGELRGKKGSHHEGGHRVPGIFYWKRKIIGGRVEKEPAGAVDLLPTICGLLGIEKPKNVFLDGSDLTPLLTGTGKFERHQPLFWMNGSTMALRIGSHTLLAPNTARLPFDTAKVNRLLQQTKTALGDNIEKELGGLDLRSRMFNGRFANPEANRLRDEFRSLFYFNEALIPLMKKGGVDRVELYDLSKDIGQQNDIAKKHPKLIAQMKKQANLIHTSVMADGPEYVTPEDLTAAKKPRGNALQRPVAETSSSKTADLLARIEKNPLPDGYQGSSHQAYVDKVMAGLKPKQRARVGQLWKEKRRIDPDMPNPGASYIKILTHVAEGAREADPAGRPSGVKTQAGNSSRQKVAPSNGPKVSVASATKAPLKTNVILIMADDIGYECYGAYGGTSYKTPVLDRMARQGMRFDHAYSNPVCTPSRVKIMTGLSNVRNYAAFGILRQSERTIGHMMKDAGYRTAIAGKWQLLGTEHYPEQTRGKGSWPQDAGFQRHCLWQVDKGGPRFWGPVITTDGTTQQFGKNVFGPDIYCQFLLDRMDEYQDEPFFLYYPMALVHWDHDSTKEDPHQFIPTPHSADRNNTNQQENFADMVSYMDTVIGRIVNKTVEMGIADRTLILVTGDNGTYRSIKSNIGDKVIVGGKGRPTDAGTHVALIAYQPGTVPADQICKSVVDFSDFAPTIAEATGAQPLSPTDGRSFFPQLLGRKGNPRENIFIYYCPKPETSKPLRFVRNERWKLYGNNRLFDVANDVLEKKPVTGPASKGIRKQLQAALDQMPSEGQKLMNFD